LRARFEAVFATKTRDEWCGVFDASDACFAPVLTFAESASHPHAVARRAHVGVGTVTQPAPAPRLSRTPGEVRGAPPERGAQGREALTDWGFSRAEIARFVDLGLGFEDR
jgi:alpha-methylacyl-CoA racemase